MARLFRSSVWKQYGVSGSPYICEEGRTEYWFFGCSAVHSASTTWQIYHGAYSAPSFPVFLYVSDFRVTHSSVGHVRSRSELSPPERFTYPQFCAPGRFARARLLAHFFRSVAYCPGSQLASESDLGQGVMKRGVKVVRTLLPV